MLGQGFAGRVKAIGFAAALATCLVPSAAHAELIVEDIVSLSPQGDPGRLAVLPNGDVLATASPPSQIVRVTPDGTKTTVAGTGDIYLPDGLPATQAELRHLADVESTPDGGFLISSVGAVQYVDAEGMIETVAGMGFDHQVYGGDGGLATEATLVGGSGLASTPTGFLVSDMNRVREVDASGEINTVAGGSSPGFAGDGGPATAAMLDAAAGLDTTTDGGFLIADLLTCRIRKVDSTGEINTVAGSGPPSVHNDIGGLDSICGPVVDHWTVDLGVPGPALEAELNQPIDVAAEADGGFLIATQAGEHILRVTPEGMVEVVAGTGLQGWGGDGCPADAVAVNHPFSVATGDGVVYYSDTSLIQEGTVHTALRRVVEGEVTDCELIGLQGGDAPDDVDGSEYREKIFGAGGGDEIDPGGGKDTVNGEDGGDKINVKGGGTDSVNCGSGRDVVVASGKDKIAKNCEVVR